MIRLLNATSRAVLVLLVVISPAFLLPGATRTGQEISLIMGALIAVFTIFEYASNQPGLIDFRYAPPYNRVRFATFGFLLFSLVFLCRATEGVDSFSASILALSDRAVELLSFPVSPHTVAMELVAAGGDSAFVTLLGRAAAVSIFVGAGGLLFFTLFVWVLRWPAERDSFNLWVNLPTFDPTVGKDIAWRLRRGGLINLMVGLAFPYALVALVSRSGGWFDPSALANYQSLVWGCTLWMFLPVVLFNRGMAMLKIAWLIDMARSD